MTRIGTAIHTFMLEIQLKRRYSGVILVPPGYSLHTSSHDSHNSPARPGHSLSSPSSADVHNLFESFPKLGIEDRVNYGVDEAVHVAQPSGQYEDRHSGPTVRIQFRAHGVQDVCGEKRHPAYEEDT